MSVIKQISVFNGSDWNTGDIGADASNIDISSAILGSSTNVQSALTTIGNKIGTTAIPSALGTTITGAINTLNTNLNTNVNTRRAAFTPHFYYTVDSSTATVSNTSCIYHRIGKLLIISGRTNVTNSDNKTGFFIACPPVDQTGIAINTYYNYGVGAAGIIFSANGTSMKTYMLRSDNKINNYCGLSVTDGGGSGIVLPSGYYSYFGFLNIP